MFTIVISLVIAGYMVVAFRFLNKTYKPPILGVYQQKNKYYHIKFLVLFVALSLKKLIAHVKRLLAVELGHSDDGTKHVHRIDEILENKYNVSDTPTAVDGVYFNGISKSGAAIVCGLAHRPQNICDAFFMLKLDDKELFLSPSLPETYLKQDSGDYGEYSVQGIKVEKFVPMRTWRLTYNGEMKPKNDLEKRVKVEAELLWSANFCPFNYDVHMSTRSVARDMAREPWSYDYFKLLKKLHQTHYEQMGTIKGIVKLDGIEHAIDMPCVRDHSYGPNRNWKGFHRYVYHFMYLENGDAIAVGTVSQPAVLSHLTVGYLCRHSDQRVYPVVSSDFQLYQHGENQVLPRDYGFTFRAGRENYTVRVQVKDEETFYIGKEKEAKFYERWSTVDVNGVKGTACVEWHYNNVQAANRS